MAGDPLIAAMVADMSSRARADRALHAANMARVSEALDEARSAGSPDADDLAIHIASGALNPDDFAFLSEVPLIYPQTTDRRIYTYPTREGVATFRVVRDADDHAVGLADTDGAPIELPDFVWALVRQMVPSQAEWEAGRNQLVKQGISRRQLDEWREETITKQAAMFAEPDPPSSAAAAAVLTEPDASPTVE